MRRNAADWCACIRQGGCDGMLQILYKDTPVLQNEQRQRYAGAVSSFAELFGEGEGIRLFSTPGRTEVGGNHTDHNGGQVLAASVDLDALAAARAIPEPVIRLFSEGYGMSEVKLSGLGPAPERFHTTDSLIAGVAAGFQSRGLRCGGFEAYVTSRVLQGSGLSSSAAFEVCVGTILNQLYNAGRVDAPTLAQISQFAENEYFGKPCGLMDQTACAVGGFVNIDFASFEHPRIERVTFDFARCGFALCVVDTGGNHADLNDDYAAIEAEMKQAAALLGADVLARTSKAELLARLSAVRKGAGDRAALRALHFFNDDRRVREETAALRRGDFAEFRRLVIESGRSSFEYCQNVYANSSCREQGLSIALMLAEELLAEQGAWRVHGGGFAGTIQAFVPEAMVPAFRQRMRGVFGADCFYELMIRPIGTTEILPDSERGRANDELQPE